MRFALAFLFASMIGFSVAQAAPAPSQTCINASFIDSFEIQPNDTIRLRSGARSYDLDMQMCSQLSWAQQLRFESFGSQICRGDTVILMDFTGAYLDRCWINGITEVQR